MSELNHWQRILVPEISRTPWLIAMDVVVAGGGVARELRTLGATEILILGGSMGTGAPPDEQHICLDLPPADSMMAGIRQAERAMDALPQKALARVDHFDPGFSARAWRPFFSAGEPVAGRPTFGARPQAWQALEDKTQVEALWQKAGIPHAPSRVLAPERQAILDAWSDLDRGQGVVLSGDMKAGFNGGAAYVRWLRSAGDLDRELPLFTWDCERVRLMPLLEGIPCSMHGFVVGEEVAAFVPCEMLVLRRPSGQFVYCSTATSWEPAAEDTLAMTEVVQRVGRHLSRTLGYRGAFTVDGVLGAHGFWPTELNPRVGAAMFPLFGGLDIPITALHFAAIEDLDLDFRLGELQTLVRENAPRTARAGLLLPQTRTETETRWLRKVGTGFAWCEEADAHWKLSLGPGPMGSYLSLGPLEGALEPAAPVGPQLVPLIAWVDGELGLGIGELEAAKV